MSATYNPADWYWIVAGSTTQVYSSRAVNYVQVSNPTYQAWLAGGNTPTRIASEQDLIDVLAVAEVPLPPGRSPSDAIKEMSFNNIQKAVSAWAFDVDNRVRILEGQPQRTKAQFKTYVKSLM